MRKTLATLLIGAMAMGCANNAGNQHQTNNKTPEAEQTPAMETTENEEASDYEDDSTPIKEFNYFFEMHNKPLKVTGNADIEGFVKALFAGDEYSYTPDEAFDKANGYFSMSAAGGGYLDQFGAFWNRKDGKKMFLFSFDQGETGLYDKCIERKNEWYQVAVYEPREEDGEPGGYYESGILAYLYNPDTKTLEPMQQPPFNGVPKTDGYLSFALPQKGKDIVVGEMDLSNYDRTEHTLKFNGLTFDWVE